MLQIFFFSNFGCSAPECSPSEVSRLQPPRVSLKKWGQSVEKGNSRLLATLALSYCHALPTAQLPPLYPLLALMDGQDVAVGLGMILSLSITFSLFQFVKNCFSLFHVWVVCHILSLSLLSVAHRGTARVPGGQSRSSPCEPRGRDTQSTRCTAVHGFALR